MGRCVLSMEVGGLPHGSTALGQRAPAEDVVFWRPFAPAAGLHGGADSCLDGSAADEAPRPPDACRRRPPVGLAPSPNSAFRPVRVKRLQCSYCGVSFLNNGELVGHLRVHTGDRPYKCEACERAFARNEELTRHRRIHSGDKPHACDVCAKRFARKDHLSKHRKTHLDEAHKRVHVCSQPGCGHRYTRTDALTRHQWTAHAIRRCNRWPPDAPGQHVI
ncbi:endothelial zinc finger protein induced by tumor necrosis factor alpha [Dermacentor silvarum]|uniref:endothelial zinc finger protein induced by tumor necrosis factor alpha n=1 Tax=Dermacentor silvarum TaxID=543639 RepID=UPI001898A49D|nr:endothelial zinc finger protein induced by tumor necrosis factor alpha [Dermacentor silvarum]